MILKSDKIQVLKTKLIETLEGNILNFWLTKTSDPENGGFYGLIDDKNVPVKDSPKGAVLNTRILWTFSAAFNFNKSLAYKEFADRAYIYISDYFLDKKYGGIYWELDYKGIPINKRKQVYAQAFAIYSFTEYYKISGQKDALDKAISLYRLIEKHSLDNKKRGYIDAFGEDWSGIQDLKLSEKDENAPKTMNTHLHILEAYANLYKVWKDDSLRDSLKNLIILFMEKFIDQRGHLVLFFDNDWNRIEDFCSFGHDIEFTWLLTEAAEVLGDDELIDKTRVTAVNTATVVLREGITKDGGLMNEYDYPKGKFDSDKHWWQQAEAMVGFYNAYKISGDEKFLDSMFRVWNFIDKYIIDHKNGEWFWKVDNDGKVYPGMEKAGFWKCPYHNSRAVFELLEKM